MFARRFMTRDAVMASGEARCEAGEAQYVLLPDAGRRAAGTYAAALAEIRSGQKRSHWMWYVFPQVAGLGASETSQHYAIGGPAEARAYLAQPVFGPRLVECVEVVLKGEGRSAHEIFGSPDVLKLRSCATLFAQVSPPGSMFERLLAKYFEGERDATTLALLTGSGT